jgi:hypothetical protein
VYVRAIYAHYLSLDAVSESVTARLARVTTS